MKYTKREAQNFSVWKKRWIKNHSVGIWVRFFNKEAIDIQVCQDLDDMSTHLYGAISPDEENAENGFSPHFYPRLKILDKSPDFIRGQIKRHLKKQADAPGSTQTLTWLGLKDYLRLAKSFGIYSWKTNLFHV
jgi:hypothetical protein